MKFLDGYKTITGLLIVIAAQFGFLHPEAIGPVTDAASQVGILVGSGVTVVGVVHKAIKAVQGK